MILEYINAAMEKARYEIIEDDEPYYAEVPGLRVDNSQIKKRASDPFHWS